MKFSTPKKIRFHHCDPAGIVFYPQFFYLLHEAQEDFFAHIGFPEHDMIKAGHGVPIVDLKTQFLGMCRNGDDINIDLTLSKLGQSSIAMGYNIISDGHVRLHASGVVVYSTVPAGKPVRIPDDLRQALQPYLQSNGQETP
jgi:4-hydroxybenzoyl-CoA thioesterase